MADSEVRQKFEARVLETIKYSKREDFVIGEYGYDNPNLQEWFRWFAAGMRAGEIAMREKAANLASDLWEADENLCASPMCSEIPAAIRALPAAPEEKKPAISGAEESKK